MCYSQSVKVTKEGWLTGLQDEARKEGRVVLSDAMSGIGCPTCLLFFQSGGTW